MFDFSFSELMLIGVVALVVIGPERLPKVARTAGQWLGRLNRYASQVKQDIDRDMKLEELRKMQQEMKDTAQRYEIQAKDGLQRVEDTVHQEAWSISKSVEPMNAGEPVGEAAPAAAATPVAEATASVETGSVVKTP